MQLPPTIRSKIRRSLFSRTVLLIVVIIFALNFIFLISYNGQSRQLYYKALQEGLNLCYMLTNTPRRWRYHAAKVANVSDLRINVTITMQPRWQLRFYLVDRIWHVFDKLADSNGRFVRFSYSLDNGEWLNIQIDSRHHMQHVFLLLMVIELTMAWLMLLYIWTLRRFAKPLQEIKNIMEKDVFFDQQPKSNPGIVDETVDIISKMHNRVAYLVQEHTWVLAALSHDLRTLVTRLKLRLQFLEYPAIKQKMLILLDEIEENISITLVFAKQIYGVDKKSNIIDIVSLIESICADLQDVGYQVIYKSDIKHSEFYGDSFALKAAFKNFINHAIRHSRVVNVQLQGKNNNIKVIIETKCNKILTEHPTSHLTFNLSESIIAQYQGAVEFVKIDKANFRILINLIT